MHKREKILDAVIQKLKDQVTLVEGRVFKGRVYPMEEQEIPGICVYITNEDSELVTTAGSRIRQCTLDVQIQMYVKYESDDFINLSNDQSVLQTTSIILSLPTGQIKIAWGDGETTIVDGPITSIDYTHDYMETGIYGLSISGDIRELTRFNISNQDFVSGDISQLSGLLSMLTLQINNTSLTGDISAFSGLTDIHTIQAGFLNIQGNLSSLLELKSLRLIQMQNTDIEGDILNIADANDITNIQFQNTNVSGDLGNLIGLTVITQMTFNNTDIIYNTITLPNWDGCIFQLISCDWSDVMVDAFLIDMDTMSIDSTQLIDLTGINASPSTEGLEAVTSLESKGWTVDVNEP